MSFRVEVFPAATWAAAVAERWLGAGSARPHQTLCLPTGATPRPVYGELAAHDADLTDTEVFLLDEFGGLPIGSPGRCDQMLRTDLLDLLARPPARVHTYDMAADDIPGMCARYEADLPDAGLDLTVLGLGGNGHIGLNEPGSARDSRTRPVRLEESTSRAAGGYGAGPEAPTWGVTLGIGTLLESAEIWLLVTGAHKAAILADVVRGPIGPHVPASFLREHPNTTVLADERAAAEL